MKLIKMECPYCGASLEVEEGKKRVFCQYCGKEILLDDEKKESVVTIKDEAKIKEADLKAQQYKDDREDKKKQEKKAFNKTKGFKLIIVLIVLDLLGALVAFNDGKAFAGIIAILQIALLVIAIMIGSGSLDKIRGKHIPSVIYIIGSIVLFIPYYSLYNRHITKKEKLVWPTTELAERIPDPDAKYGDVIVSNNKNLYVDVDDYDEDDYQNYVSKCKDAGFTVDADNDTSMYKAADSDGYILTLMSYSDSMTIDLDAPADYKDITWPVNDLAALLPAPPSSKGSVEKDTSSELDVLIGNIDDNQFSEYEAAVLAAGFNIDYVNEDNYFNGKNADGYEVTIRDQIGDAMEIQMEAPEETVAETGAPEPTTEATATPEPTPSATSESSDSSTAANGIRPEFKEAMDSYAAFFDSYCDFMKSYDSSDLTMLTKYSQMMTQYADTMEKLDAVDESDLSPEEDDYYLQTMAHINQELLETAQYVN